jgi:uncharacterized protein (TIGR02594 family)
LQITPYDLALRFTGMSEAKGSLSNPQVVAMLRLDDTWPEDDSVPWCSAFVNFIAWLLRLPRSKSLRARSWLEVGIPIPLADAHLGFDVVIFRRDGSEAAGHVGFYAATEGAEVWVLGGNQGDKVSVAPYLAADVLGVRRLA